MASTAQQLWTWLITTCAITIATMVTGVWFENQALTILAGAMFAVVASVVGWRFAAIADPTGDRDALAARFAQLMSTAWAWAGFAMLGCYYLTDLSWQHAWQYGAGMLLIAFLVLAYARARVAPGSRFAKPDTVSAARWMTRLQGLAALSGVIILALSGKLDAGKQDWAANVVFVTGGLAIFALSRAALRTEDRTPTRTTAR